MGAECLYCFLEYHIFVKTGVLSQMSHSVWYFLKLVFSWSLHQPKSRIGERYQIDKGKSFTVFRETISTKEYRGKEVTLIVGFRLRVVRYSKTLHWLFQRLSVLDTPIWVGFVGFKTKFWMVNPQNNDYLGIYRYQGKENAEQYARYICKVLIPFSVKNSIWYKIENKNFDVYIESQLPALEVK